MVPAPNRQSKHENPAKSYSFQKNIATDKLYIIFYTLESVLSAATPDTGRIYSQLHFSEEIKIFFWDI